MTDSAIDFKVISPDRHSAGSESIVLPEALTEGLLRIQDKIMRERWVVKGSASAAAS